MENPFIDFNENLPHQVSIPRYPRTKGLYIKISQEALDTIRQLANKFTNGNVTTLFEQIGLYVLQVKRPTTEQDTESKVTTDDCRESGYQDGVQGNPQYFLQMFNKQLEDTFQEAYMRGYYEGSYMRNKRSAK